MSCLPTLSLGAGDEWDCHSRGQLAAHCQRSLLSLSLPPPEPPRLRLSRQQRRANVPQRILAVEPEPLSRFGVAGERDEVPGEQGSQPL